MRSGKRVDRGGKENTEVLPVRVNLDRRGGAVPEPWARAVGARGRACDSQHSFVKVINYMLPGVQVIPKSDSALSVHLFAHQPSPMPLHKVDHTLHI